MKCHCKKGTNNNLIMGIYNSCNTYFAKTFKSLIESKSSPSISIDLWKKHLEKFGLGNYLGYDLPIGKEDSSLVVIIMIDGIQIKIGELQQ